MNRWAWAGNPRECPSVYLLAFPPKKGEPENEDKKKATPKSRLFGVSGNPVNRTSQAGLGEGVGDFAEEVLQLSAEDGQHCDHNDGHEGENQPVFNKGLALFGFEVDEAAHGFGVEFGQHGGFLSLV